MEFKLTKASDYEFKKIIDIETLDELLEAIKFYRYDLILRENTFYKTTNEECQDELIDIKYEIMIYDDYLE